MVKDTNSNPVAISVILPYYNASKTLLLAVKSITSQSFDNFELLLINDGSTDDSFQIASSIQDARIRLLGDSGQKGLVSRLNEGVKFARGKYIARMDADDVSFANRLEKQFNFLEANPQIDLLGCRAVVFKNSNEIIGLLPFHATHERLCRKKWANIPLPHPTWMGKASWFKQNHYKVPAVYRAEDQELLLRCSNFSKYACLEEVLLGYRQGAFRFCITVKARWSLLLQQVKFFFANGNLISTVFSCGIFIIKTVVDLLTVAMPTDKLFFLRMSESVSEEVKQKLLQLLTIDGTKS